MDEQPRAWHLERNGDAAFAAVCGEFALYGENHRESPRRAKGCKRNPAWQLLLSWDAPLVDTQCAEPAPIGPGMLIPPGLSHAIRASSGYTSVWIDPYCLSVKDRRSAHALDRAETAMLLESVSGDLVPERVRETLNRVFGQRPEVDDRLLAALRLIGTGTPIEDVAEQAGVSARRLRQLSVQYLDGTLRNLRRWHRLREAGLQLPFRPAAEVAVSAGFADQSHLTRTMVALCGRTPGSSLSSAG